LTLWIVPREQVAAKLERVMHIKENEPNLAPGSYPRFYPHITLASLPASMESDLDALRASIPQLESPLECSFASMAIGTSYFRSVYIAVEPTMEVLDLHKRVHEALHLEPKTPSFPHMSLCYVDDEDAAKGERAVYYDTLRMQGKYRKAEPHPSGIAMEGVLLNCKGVGEEDDWVNAFEASEVWAVKCDGPVGTWQVLARYPIVGK